MLYWAPFTTRNNVATIVALQVLALFTHHRPAVITTINAIIINTMNSARAIIAHGFLRQFPFGHCVTSTLPSPTTAQRMKSYCEHGCSHSSSAPGWTWRNSHHHSLAQCVPDSSWSQLPHYGRMRRMGISCHHRTHLLVPACLLLVACCLAGHLHRLAWSWRALPRLPRMPLPILPATFQGWLG